LICGGQGQTKSFESTHRSSPLSPATTLQVAVVDSCECDIRHDYHDPRFSSFGNAGNVCFFLRGYTKVWTVPVLDSNPPGW